MRSPYQVWVLGLVALLLALSWPAPIVAEQDQARGINPADLDLSVDPRDDFYRFANGGWLDRTEIPSDQPSYGTFEELTDLTTRQQLALLDLLTSGGELEEGSDEWKAVQLFTQGTDLATRNAQGKAPIETTLAEIEGISDLDGLHRFLAGSRFKGVHGFFAIDVLSDPEDSTIWAAHLDGPELWLPERDYYLSSDERLEEIRTAYIETLAELLIYAGYDESRAHASAQAVYDVEKTLAETHVEQRDSSPSKNRMTIDELQEQYPLLDWSAYLSTLGLADTPEVIATETEYLAALDTIVRETPLATIKDALILQLLWTHRIYLDEEIQEISFDFRGRVLAGVQELPPIEERVLDNVNGVMGEALGQLYVAEHFPPEAKAEMEVLVQELIVAYRARLEQNPWMSESAKEVALDKLSKMIVNVGYPDTWRSYDEVVIQDSFVGSIRSALSADYRRQLAHVGEPIDKTEWSVPPQEVHAYYDFAANSINFPAGILQPPFFDYRGDAAANFGAIGFVIGHEITHGYDRQGSRFDADGNVNGWYTPQDQERFNALNHRVVDQYDAVEVLPDLFVDGQATVTENVADMGGLQVAFDALQNSLHAESDAATPGVRSTAELEASPIASLAGSPMAFPVAARDLMDLSAEQRFFIAASSVWRAKIRDEFLETLVNIDVHAPAPVRATLPLQNMDAFQEAFSIQPGDAMYLPPEERIVVW